MQTQKATTGKANPLPVVLSLTVSARMRSLGSVRHRKRRAIASPPPQDDLWVVVKNLSQQFAAQQTELATLSNAFALQQKTIADLEKINRDLEKVLSNMASQMTSTNETTQTALAAILARLEVKPDVPKGVVADIDYPPLPPTGATSKRKTAAHPPTAGWNASPKFRKAGAAAWLALKREYFSPCTQCTESGALLGSPTHLCKRFSYAKPGRPSKGHAGSPHPYKRIWTRLSLSPSKPGFLAPKQQTRISSLLSRRLLAKTVTTIQRSPDVKARNFFRSLLASIGGKTLEAATAEAAKIRVQTPGFDISTMETVPKESLPVKKVTDKEPAAPAVDPPLDTAAEITPAIQVDGATPTVPPIADVEMCFGLVKPSRSHTIPFYSRSNPGSQMEHVSKIDRRTTKHGARFRITVPKTDNTTSSQRLERQASSPLAYSAKLPTSPSRPASTTAPPPPLSRHNPRSHVAQYSNKRPAIRHIVQEHQALGHLKTCITSSKFRFNCPWIRCPSSIQPRAWTQRNRPRYPIMLWWS
ncbi:hypothetical protein BASA84_001386 [Batrachochytrium salamandrivorans]|nr:hypothetical protein BASA84_001386 [Batrachochytrium salamandrivorans]